MVRIRTLLILFIAVSGILATIAFISHNQLQSAPPPPEEELEFWYENCGEGYPHRTCICGVSTVPVKSPQTFKMSTINFYEDREVITLHTYYFGTELDSGAKIASAINATSLVNLQIAFVNRTDADVLSLANEVAYYSRPILEAPRITSYLHELNVQEKGLYIFAFDVAQPKPVATVTFKADVLPGMTTGIPIVEVVGGCLVSLFLLAGVALIYRSAKREGALAYNIALVCAVSGFLLIMVGKITGIQTVEGLGIGLFGLAAIAGVHMEVEKAWENVKVVDNQRSEV